MRTYDDLFVKEVFALLPWANAVAVDWHEVAFAYIGVPTRGSIVFSGAGCPSCLGTVVLPDGVTWEQSLRLRPEDLATKYPNDTLVLVRGYGYTSWAPRYSAGKVDSEGWLLCWDNGVTSKTTDGRSTAWKEVKPYESNHLE